MTIFVYLWGCHLSWEILILALFPEHCFVWIKGEIFSALCLASSISPVRSYPYQRGLFAYVEELPKHEQKS